MYLFLISSKTHRFSHALFQLWAKVFFFISGLWIKKEYRYKPEPKKTYVFVANHFSYLDIAVGMGIIDHNFAFVGKSSVSKMPLLGYLFKKLHIAVDRGDKNSRSKTLVRGIKSLARGKSIFIMPEGGILSTNIPKMHQPLKDGPFVMAVENGVPIIPITFKNLYDIMPKTTIKGGRPHVIFHEAIETKGLNKKDIPMLKERVYNTIQGELDAFYKMAPTPFVEK
ncbi:1-acyl-sn-glycerol-3-phosphate acyltransferase [Spirosomataceae bacterium TFI 002]|nr:1-acyl-sn-glycerol-3-phosphate acyltransferase [Spirosomataceae bacterium TFI 002]